MLSVSDLHKDALIQIDGAPYRVIDYQHTQLGRGGAIAKTKLKNLSTGSVLSKTFKGSEKVEAADVDRRDLQYLYQSGGQVSLMDASSYEQYQLAATDAGEGIAYVPDGQVLIGLVFNGHVVGLELPAKVVVTVAHTEPAVRGDTAKAAQKSARLDNGTTVQVPLFIKTGDRIRVDTRSGKYIERV